MHTSKLWRKNGVFSHHKIHCNGKDACIHHKEWLSFQCRCYRNSATRWIQLFKFQNEQKSYSCSYTIPEVNGFYFRSWPQRWPWHRLSDVDMVTERWSKHPSLRHSLSHLQLFFLPSLVITLCLDVASLKQVLVQVDVFSLIQCFIDFRNAVTMHCPIPLGHATLGSILQLICTL